MRYALALAAQARGLTSPNPMVGAVVAHGETIVAEGFHRAPGEPHAEIEALRAAGERSRGATLYVTLEPCAHQGRTPPCAPQVIASGVHRVVVAVGDPNPRVAGRGLTALRDAGIQVTVGVLAEEAGRLNRAFLHSMTAGRPLVVLKGAITLDGKIADVHGASRWITGEAARAQAHRLRAEADAIVVGIETVLHDDPELTVRLGAPWPREPYRIVLDSSGRTPPSARLFQVGTPERVLVAVSGAAPPARLSALETIGAAVLRGSPGSARVDLRMVLATLHARDARTVLVEGGGEVHGSFVDAGLVDRVAVFVAPVLLGGRQAPGLVGGAGRALKDRLRLVNVEVRSLGGDLLIEADVARDR